MMIYMKKNNKKYDDEMMIYEREKGRERDILIRIYHYYYLPLPSVYLLQYPQT